MSSSGGAGTRIPGRPPPPDRMSDRVRRRLRAVGSYAGLRHWLLVRGSLVLVAFGLLYVVNGLKMGWQNTYDVTIGIKSPGDVKVPVLPWFMSVAGWLAAPAVCGAVAGVVISVAVQSRRQRPIAEVLTKQDGPAH